MLKYTAKRLLYLIPVTFCVIFIIHLIMFMTPGDPTTIILGADATPELIAETRAQLGLDDPFLVQFWNYVSKLVQGDFGMSYTTQRPVAERLFAAIPYTLTLSFAALALAMLVSIPLGIMAAVKQNTVWDYGCSLFAMVGVSAPTFWVGLMLMLLFSVELGWLPAAGVDTWQGYILPTVTQAINLLAGITRTMRSSMLEVTRQDYIRTAYAKGVSRRNVLYNHALRNAIIPAVTVAGLNFGMMVAGTVAIESVFAIPGLGRIMINAIQVRDTPTVLGSMIVLSIAITITNLVVDLVYALIDPRIMAQYKSGGKKA